MLANFPCAICGGSTRLLICDECLPAEKVRQSATVRVGNERNPITMRLRAGDATAGTRLDVTMKIEWNHDRGREERKVIVTDQRSGRYWQRWYSLETGEVTWEKEGSRTDQSIHGPESHRPDAAPDQ